MDIRNVLRRLGKPRGKFGALAFQFRHPRLHRRLIQSVLDRCHNARDRALDLGQRALVSIGLNALLAVLANDMRRVGGDRRVDLVGRYEPIGDARECARLQYLAPDRPTVRTGAPPMMTDTAIAVANDDRIVVAADAAFEEARE